MSEPKKEGKFLKFVNIISYKIGQQRHLAALKDALIFMMPLIIVGAMGVLGVTIIFGGWDSQKVSLLGLIWMAVNRSTDVVFTGAFLEISNFGTNLFSFIKSAGIDTIALFASFFIGFFIGQSRKNNAPLYVGMASLVSFFIMNKFNWEYMDSKGLFSAIIVSLLAAELYNFLTNLQKIQITMPKTVPPAISRAFNVLIPFLLTLGTFALLESFLILIATQTGYNITGITNHMLSTKDINNILNDPNSNIVLQQGGNIDHATALSLLNYFNIGTTATSSVSAIWSGDAITIYYESITTSASDMNFTVLFFHFISLPIINLAGGTGGLGIVFLHQFLAAFFGFFGIHGANVTSGIFDPIWLATNNENVVAIQAGNAPPHIFTQAFMWGFANIGGTGSTLMLIVGVLLFSRNKAHREISKFGLPAGIFQVNEPIVYGFPIVASPMHAIPYMINPILTVTIAWLFIGPLGIVNKPIILMPWTMPNLISQPLITKDFKALLITISQMIVAFLVWLPTILIDNRINHKNSIKHSISNK